MNRGDTANVVLNFTLDGDPIRPGDFDEIEFTFGEKQYTMTTLTGQKYTHVTSVYAIDTGRKSEPNVIQVPNNFMVNPGNVANVAKRVAGYYSIAKEVSYTMRVTNERPGDKVTFKDPFGDQQTGYIIRFNGRNSAG